MPQAKTKKAELERRRKLKERALEQFKDGMPEKTRKKIGKASSIIQNDLNWKKTKGKIKSQKLSKKLKGRIFTESWRRNLSKKRKKLFKEGKITNWCDGLTKETDERLLNISLSKMGDKNPAKRPEVRKKLRLGKLGNKTFFWCGGISKIKKNYTIPEELREQIRKRDNYRCQQCFRHQDELFTKTGRKRKLDTHHIDFDETNDNPNNLISLCHVCHNQTQFNRKNWIKYFKERLNDNPNLKGDFNLK